MANSDLNIPSDFLEPPLDSGSYILEDQLSLPSPPLDLPVRNTYPPEEWRFTDQAQPEFRDDIVEREPFDSGETEQKYVLDENDRREIMEVIKNSERIHQVLEGQRHTIIGASLRNHPPKNGSASFVEVLAYNYDADTSLVIRLEGTDEYEVTSIDQTTYLPPPTVEEAEKAVQLARESEELADTGVSEMEAGVLRDYSHLPNAGENASEEDISEEEIRSVVNVLNRIDIPERITSPIGNYLGVRPGGDVEDTGRRRLDVRFRMPGERGPRFYALVDLTNETVVEAGPVR